MAKESEDTIPCSGCGCLMALIWAIVICFCCTVLYHSCNSGSLWKGAVQTTKEYYSVADSIWNDK